MPHARAFDFHSAVAAVSHTFARSITQVCFVKQSWKKTYRTIAAIAAVVGGSCPCVMFVGGARVAVRKARR